MKIYRLAVVVVAVVIIKLYPLEQQKRCFALYLLYSNVRLDDRLTGLT